MKKIISIALSLLIVSVLAGCSGGAKKTDTTPAQGKANVEGKKEAAKEEPKKQQVVTYKDGTYEGTGQGMHEIKVSVQVVNGKIAKVNITHQEEEPSIAKPAIEKIPAAIVEKNSPDVDVVAGASRASQGIIDAVKNALEAAK